MEKELSARARVIQVLLRQGKSTKEMSEILGISPRAVQTYLRHIYWYLGVQTKSEAIVALYQSPRRSKSDRSGGI
ncbi:MAG TPA: helix-turn-helix transcriptional regulator [Nitrospira sp.]|nr:helix-turn-helix transcriptional regulator [Nitrospira sp.]